MTEPSDDVPRPMGVLALSPTFRNGIAVIVGPAAV
jgi:hypothetical protein